MLEFSIIFAELRPETTERISVGMIIVDGPDIEIKYSEGKLKALRHLFPKGKYEFIDKAVRALPQNKSISSKGDIEYLNRYSNNLLSVSRLETIDIESTETNKNWLFNKYVQV